MAIGNPQRGEQRYNAKLTAHDVRLIRALVDERRRLIAEARNLSDKAIAEKFGVHKNVVWKVSARAGWIHVPD